MFISRLFTSWETKLEGGCVGSQRGSKYPIIYFNTRLAYQRIRAYIYYYESSDNFVMSKGLDEDFEQEVKTSSIEFYSSLRVT